MDTKQPKQPPLPQCPFFSCGPCAKPPGWRPEGLLEGDLVARSHRSDGASAALTDILRLMRALLELPSGYEIGIIGGSATGAIEAAFWNLLGPRPVTVPAYDAFSQYWAHTIKSVLKLDSTIHTADYGEVPDLSQIDFDHDVILTWNATTAGVQLPRDGGFIPDNRKGLVFADATSSAFSIRMPIDKLDVVTFAWQKGLGGEGQHGMLVLSPRAVARLKAHPPEQLRPVPQIFRFWRDGEFHTNWENGSPINTISMLSLADVLDALHWAEQCGGATGLEARTETNAKVIYDWAAATPWVTPLVKDPLFRSAS